VDWSAYTTLEVLGLDEIALKKGHRDFVAIVTSRLTRWFTLDECRQYLHRDDCPSR